MNASAFLDHVAARLGRPRAIVHAPREVAGAPSAAREAIDGGSLVELFARESAAVGATVHVVRSADEARTRVAAILEDLAAERLVSVARGELRAWPLDDAWKRGCVSWEGGDDAAAAHFRRAASQAQVGIANVDFAVASTGSLLLTSAPTRPRCVSLLPTVHLALVRSEQILPSLGDAMREILRRDGRVPTAALFVTGPSRTSDIENDLTIGVHGPAAVIVVVLNAPAAPSP